MGFPPEDYSDSLHHTVYGQLPSPTMSAADILGLNPIADVVVGVMNFDYEMISPTAWDSAYIAFDSTINQYILQPEMALYDTVFYDTVYYSTHPDSIMVIDTIIHRDEVQMKALSFDQLKLAVIAPLYDGIGISSFTDSVSFAFPKSFFFSQQSVWVDFEDGQGFVQIYENDVHKVVYSSSGEKTLRMCWFEPLDANPETQAVCNVMVRFLKRGSPDAVLTDPYSDRCDIDLQEGTGSIAAFIKYRKNGDGKLHKPIILVEGFESTRIDPKRGEYDLGDKHGFGDLNWRNYSSGIFVNKDGDEVAPQLALFPDLMDSLNENGYDIVLVDIHSNRVDIRKNANSVIQLIMAVNDSLDANGSTEEISIIGASMGGAIVRYAVRKMELEGCCHNIGAYGTFASPHRGANIPLSIQEFLYAAATGMAPKEDADDAMLTYTGVMNSKAARQMLLVHREPTAANDHQAFYSELDNMGHPQNCRTFALSSGSAHGHGQYEFNRLLSGKQLQPGDELLEINARIPAPMIVPDIVLPVLTVLDIVFDSINMGGFWTMMNATAYAKQDYELNPSLPPQLILMRGRNFQTNLNHFFIHSGIWLAGTVVFFLNELAHDISFWLALANSSCLPCPFILGSKSLTSVYISLAFTASLGASWAINQNANFNSSHDVYHSGVRGYDHVPGDFHVTIQRIADMTNGAAKVKFPHHTFMPTISSLDIDTSDLFLNVEDNKLFLMENYIPFESVYLNMEGENGGVSINQRHVELDTSNIKWIMETLRNTTGQPFSMSLGNPHYLSLNQYLNYGFPESASIAPEAFIRSIDIQNNGELFINKKDIVGYQSNPFSEPEAHSHFSMRTVKDGCNDSHVRIFDGGLFQLGNWEDIHNNTAQVTFQENSVLEIMSGGKLIIDKNSRLIIEEGATLIFHPGAIIELNGSNAILEIKGKVEVKDNAVFTFTSQDPSNYGHIIFNQRQWINGNEVPVTEYWEIGDNAQFVLEGAHAQGNVLMECKQNFRTSTGSLPKFSLLKLKNGAVQISENHNANLTADSVYFEGLLVDDNEQGTIKHNGIQLWGMNKHTAEIKTSVFKNGYHCVNAYQIGSQLPLRFDSCSFENNDTSLVVYNGAFEVFNCDFSTSELGIYTSNALKTSRIHHSIFELIEAVRVEGDESADLRIHESQFISNTTPNHKEGVAINSFYVDVSSTCSEFTQYEKAIIANDCMIDLSELAVNHFTENDTAVLLRFADGINLDNGENRFTSNGVDVIGIVNDLSLSPTVNINGTLHINARHNNKMFVGQVFSSQPLSGHVLNASSNSALLPLHTTNSGLFVQMCENAQGYEPVNPFEPAMNEISSIELVVEVLGNTYNFVDAMLIVTEFVYGNEEYEAYLLDAISNLQSVIAQVDEDINPTMSEDVKMAYIIALKMNMDLLRMAYDVHLIEVAGGDPSAPVSSYISNLSQYITTLVDAVEGYSQSADEQRALFEIFRAHVYRLAENHQQGIDLLMNLNGNYTNQTQDRIDFWLCVMSWEQDALVGNIMPDELQQNILSCYMMYNPHITYKEEDRVIEKESVNLNSKISVYPNPTSDFLYFRSEGIAQLDDELIITITDTKGKQVYFNTEVASYVMRMDISNLAQGSYIVTVNTPTKRHNATFTVVR